MLSDPALEELMGQMGTFGKYQLIQHLLHLLTAFLGGMHMFSLTFVAPTPQHRCFINALDLNSTIPTFNESILSAYIPLNARGESDSCFKYAIPGDETSDKVSCGGQYVFDKSMYFESRVFEWGMVCDNKWQRALIQTIYVFGVFNGAVFCGSLSDKYGRKKLLYLSGIMQFIFGIIGPHITNYVLYCISLFFYGLFGSGGAYVAGFVLSMEMIDKKVRTICGTAFSVAYAVGVCFVALWSYLVRDIVLLQTIFACHSVLLFGHWWLIDESIRWLWSQGRKSDAVAIVRRAVRINGKEFHHNCDRKYSIPMPTVLGREGYGITDLFKTPNLRFMALVTAFQWFAIAICFYGLAFNTGSLPGNPYFVFFLSGAADLPGHLLVILIVDKTGRRSLNAAFLLVGGVACIVTTFIPRGWVVTTIAMLAKIAMAGCFAVIYNYTAELFPTVVRTSAVGLCAMAARFGGMLTPQITLLDSLDPSVPVFIFGTVAILASFIGLFLPETLNKEMPQSIEDGEKFGAGDTAFSSCCGRSSKKHYIETRTDDDVITKLKSQQDP